MSRYYNHMRTLLNIAGIPIPASKIEYRAGVVSFVADISENSTAMLVQHLGATVPFTLQYVENNCDALKVLFSALSVAKPEGVLKLHSFSLEESDDCSVVFSIE